MYLERYTLTVLFNLHIHDVHVCTPMCGCFTLSQDEGYCLQLRGEPIVLHMELLLLFVVTRLRVVMWVDLRKVLGFH